MTGSAGETAAGVIAPRWRPMRPGDLAGVVALADAIHPDLPEDLAVFADRLALFPEGCHVLAPETLTGDTLLGYVVAHPWAGNDPPKLNTVLGALPAVPDALLIHDVALAPGARGQGAAAAIVARLLALAEAYPRAMLVSVYGTAPFWSRFGFRDATALLPPAALAAYGEDARLMVRETPK